MTATVISARGIGKRYNIRHFERYATLRDKLTAGARAFGQKLAGRSEQSRDSEPVWVLKDISFDVGKGDVAGILGRNGAGKSTLLKILSRIIAPTSGRVEIRGRVGSLLEVGTGFHPELSGRENIYLNGAILGMRRYEIDRSFDEIVSFAEVEQFIDTPVKHYSSGMYLRLAFAVAAHLNPEILLVDEVLAVGDAVFQKKCLGKMGDVARAGRTVLFVSHNMSAVQNLCKSAILLDRGTVVSTGPANQVTAEYLSLMPALAGTPLRQRKDRKGDNNFRFVSVRAASQSRGLTDTLQTGESVTFVLGYECGRTVRNVSISLPFQNHLGQHVFMCWTRMTDQDFPELEGTGEIRVHIPRLPLMPGRYSMNVWAECNGHLEDWVQEAGIVDVTGGDFFGTGRLAPGTHGGVAVEHEWHYEPHICHT